MDVVVEGRGVGVWSGEQIRVELDPVAGMMDASALEVSMGLVVSLADDFDSDALSLSLEAAPRHRKLRDAVEDVILAIHGLPAVMNAQLPQLEVYVGRAGATPGHLRNRWSARFEAFERAPSTTALGGDDSEDEDEVMTESGVAYCRTDGCSHRARRGNYGFCGKHRPYTPPGMRMCKDCGRPALAGNYGFCGFHRRS